MENGYPLVRSKGYDRSSESKVLSNFALRNRMLDIILIPKNLSVS